MEKFEYGIIGGGPAGYTAATMLATKGHSVVLFEKDNLGGTCLNRGCIPTKTLLHIANLYEEIKCESESGIFSGNISLDFNKIKEKKEYVVQKLRKNLELAVKNSGVKIVYENACVENKSTIFTSSGKYEAENIIIATGSVPRRIKGLETDGHFIMNSDDILNLDKLPKSVLIIGSGAIGIEWARIFSAFGVEVTITEMAEHLLPIADTEVSKRIERIFKLKKIKFYLGNKVEKIENKSVFLSDGTVINPEIVFVAAGREPVIPECCSDGLILGDACGEIQLAHYAIHQAKALALGIEFDKNLVPSVIYGTPEIAWVGLREQDCDDSCKKTVLPISALGKSWCDDSTDGFIKLITKDNLISGAHIVSNEASSLIHTVLIAIQNKLSVDELKKICFAHPTYSEGIFDTILRIN